MMSAPNGEDGPMSDQHRRVPERVLRAGAAAAASAGLAAAIRAAEGADTAPDPARGQLWRAAWDDVAQLVMVLSVTERGSARVAPVTTDPPAADDTSAVLDADVTVLGHQATVWGGLAVLVPFMVFEVMIGAVAAEVVDAAEQVAAGGAADGLPAGVRAGAAAASLFDPAADVRAELTDNLGRLSSAAWAPSMPGPTRTLQVQLQGRPDLAAVMQALASALGVQLPTVIDVMTGRRPVTPVQAGAVAKITGLTEDQVLSAVSPLPAGLASELDHPRWRKALRLRLGPGESEATVRVATAYGVLALAARQTGPMSTPSWPQRIRQYLAAEPPGRGDM
jgi:hypothetical protein